MVPGIILVLRAEYVRGIMTRIMRPRSVPQFYYPSKQNSTPFPGAYSPCLVALRLVSLLSWGRESGTGSMGLDFCDLIALSVSLSPLILACISLLCINYEWRMDYSPWVYNPGLYFYMLVRSLSGHGTWVARSLVERRVRNRKTWVQILVAADSNWELHQFFTLILLQNPH